MWLFCPCCFQIQQFVFGALTLLHSEWPKLQRVLAILSAKGLSVNLIETSSFNYKMGFPFKNSLEDVDSSSKTDLDPLDCFGIQKPIL